MPTLTVDRILSAAIEVLDQDGLDGLNMRELGRSLDCAPTAVYWHVKTKDELLRLAADALWAEVSLPGLDSCDWRTAATVMATDLHAMLSRHPWLVQAFGSYLLYGPGKSRHDDHLLAVYEKAGLTGAGSDRAAAAVFTYVLGNALGPAAQVSLTRRLSRSGGDPARQLADAMDRSAEIAARFPHLRERLGRAAGYSGAPAASFEFGLHAILDGIQAHLAASLPLNNRATSGSRRCCQYPNRMITCSWGRAYPWGWCGSGAGRVGFRWRADLPSGRSGSRLPLRACTVRCDVGRVAAARGRVRGRPAGSRSNDATPREL